MPGLACADAGRCPGSPPTLGTASQEDHMSDTHIGADARAGIGCDSRKALATAAYVLSLAAAPTFAGMALLTSAFDAGAPEVACLGASHASPMHGMLVMYALMSAFHSAPWLRLLSARRNRTRHVQSMP
jgi:hypothetical protein